MEIDDKKFEQLRKRVEENHKMLKKVRGVQKQAWWGSMFKWIIIIGISFGTYYVTQPLIESVSNTYNSMVVSLEEVQDTKDSIAGFFKKENEEVQP